MATVVTGRPVAGSSRGSENLEGGDCRIVGEAGACGGQRRQGEPAARARMASSFATLSLSLGVDGILRVVKTSLSIGLRPIVDEWSGGQTAAALRRRGTSELHGDRRPGHSWGEATCQTGRQKVDGLGARRPSPEARVKRWDKSSSCPPARGTAWQPRAGARPDRSPGSPRPPRLQVGRWSREATFDLDE